MSMDVKSILKKAANPILNGQENWEKKLHREWEESVRLKLGGQRRTLRGDKRNYPWVAILWKEHLL